MTGRRDFLKKLGMASAGMGVVGGAAGTAAENFHSSSLPSTLSPTRPKIRWRMQTYASPELAQYVIRPSIESFNRAANGEMVIELYYESLNVPRNEIYQALKDGFLDAVQADDTSVVPDTDISVFSGYFPFACRHSLDIPALFHHWGLEDIWSEAYGKVRGITWLGAGAWDPCHFTTIKPITSVDDFSGLRVFTFPTAGRFLSRLGVKPVKNMPWNEIIAKLKFGDGQLDGVAWSGITESYTLGWADVASHFLANSISGAWCGSYFANSESWDRLPNHLRELFRLSMDSSHYYRQHWYWNQEAKFRVEGTKLNVTSIPSSDWDNVRAEGRAFWDEVSKESRRNAEVVRVLRAYNTLMDKASSPYSCNPLERTAI